MTAAAGSRIPQTCKDCGQIFLALGAWQARCRTCYARYKASAATPSPPVPPPVVCTDPTHAEAQSIIATLRADLARARIEAYIARADAERAASQRSPIPPDQWRRLVQLCHPDRHGGSPAAHTATLWLMAVRPE